LLLFQPELSLSLAWGLSIVSYWYPQFLPCILQCICNPTARVTLSKNESEHIRLLLKTLL
jgi:hypothetical protein